MGAGGPVLTEGSYVDSYGNSTDSSSYSDTGAQFGTADPNRYITLALTFRNDSSGQSITSLTIGGVSATRIANAVRGDYYIEVWQAHVPTGTSGTISVTASSTCKGIAWGVYRLIHT